MKPRVLVIRSGENPFPFAPEESPVEIVEKISHKIVPLTLGQEALQHPIDLAVFTSQVAVRRLFEEAGLLAPFRGAIRAGQIAAVGPATANALEARGMAPAIVARGSAENILEKLPSRLDGQRVLLPRGEDASEELPERLIQRGARVAPLVLYRKVARRKDPDIEREIVERPFAAFCTTSPAAARWLFSGLSEAALERLRRTPAVVLGRFSGRFLASHGIARVVSAPEASFSSAARLLAKLAVEDQVPGSRA